MQKYFSDRILPVVYSGISTYSTRHKHLFLLLSHLGKPILHRFSFKTFLLQLLAPSLFILFLRVSFLFLTFLIRQLFLGSTALSFVPLTKQPLTMNASSLPFRPNPSFTLPPFLRFLLFLLHLSTLALNAISLTLLALVSILQTKISKSYAKYAKTKNPTIYALIHLLLAHLAL